MKVLAGCDLVIEAPELARDRRERWWRWLAPALRWSNADFDADPASQAVASAAVALNLDRQVGLVRAWHAVRGAEKRDVGRGAVLHRPLAAADAGGAGRVRGAAARAAGAAGRTGTAPRRRRRRRRTRCLLRPRRCPARPWTGDSGCSGPPQASSKLGSSVTSVALPLIAVTTLDATAFQAALAVRRRPGCPGC